MLKCVVFALTEYGLFYLSERRERIEETLCPRGVEVRFEKAQTAGYDPAGKYRKQEILFIADAAESLKGLLGEGFYCIAMYHDKNRSEDLKEALYAVEDVEQLTFRSYDEAYRRLAGLPWDILETERLAVRESTAADVPEFYRIYREPSVTYYMEDLFRDPAEETAYMESYIKKIYGFYGFGIWTVLLKSTGQVIGRAGLNVREGYDLPELGFVIDVPHQGKGYAFEVCSAVLTYAGEELSFTKVQAMVREKNEASVRLLDKLGFQYVKNVVENDLEYRLMIKKL